MSVFLVNRRAEALRRYGDLSACFQARLQLSSDVGFEPKDDRASYDSDDLDQRLADLHYADVASYATGHNTSGDWEAGAEGRVTTVFTNPIPQQAVEKLGFARHVPGVELSMQALAQAALDAQTLAAVLEPLPLFALPLFKKPPLEKTDRNFGLVDAVA